MNKVEPVFLNYFIDKNKGDPFFKHVVVHSISPTMKEAKRIGRIGMEPGKPCDTVGLQIGKDEHGVRWIESNLCREMEVPSNFYGNEEKYCSNCKHYWDSECLHPTNLAGDNDIVTGKAATLHNIWVMRSGTWTDCGYGPVLRSLLCNKEAALFEEKS